MHCAGCAARLESALGKLEGVSEARVSFLSSTAQVSGTGDLSASVGAAAAACGYSAAPRDRSLSFTALQAKRDAAALSRVRNWRLRAGLGICLWIPLETLHHFGHSWLSHGELMWLLGIGATVAMAAVGWGIFVSAWTAAKHRGVNMDTLVALGALSGWGLSVWLASTGAGAGYFAEVVALLAIISLGHWLEARGVREAGDAVRALMDLKPESAELVAPDRVIPAALVRIGDLVRVRPGGRVAVDGIVHEGSAGVDLSAITGESLPQRVTPGSSVAAGVVAIDGGLIVRATVSGDETTIERIATLVHEAQSSRAPIAKLADRICSIFVPAVLAIALATLVGWWIAGDWQRGLLAATTVLVISCPCALGIATPLAVMVGTGECARRGILLRNAEAIERMSQARTVFLDKTGTLTQGQPTVRAYAQEPGAPEDTLALAAALESRSEHPVARAVVAYARSQDSSLSASTTRGSAKSFSQMHLWSQPATFEVREFRADPGVGVSGIVQGRAVRVVRDPDATARIEIDGKLAARITCVDKVRDGSAEAVSQLRAHGLRIVVLTGDRRAQALEAARELGIRDDEVLADLTPQAKLQRVSAAGVGSVMVGDGINDAAALAAADVGIAMGSGTDVASASASSALLNNDLRSLGWMLWACKGTMATIRQNLGLAFVYNTVAIPLAALGLLGEHGPVVAASAMGLSDVCVVGNTLRLRWKLRESAPAEQSAPP